MLGIFHYRHDKFMQGLITGKTADLAYADAWTPAASPLGLIAHVAVACRTLIRAAVVFVCTLQEIG